jgi:hypothetical protein
MSHEKPEHQAARHWHNPLQFDFRDMLRWPPLGWCARLDSTEQRVLIVHGRGLEIANNWFCEGVWDGPFEGGAFKNSDCFFGSGGIAQGDQLTFVSSCAPMDRLYHIDIGTCQLISNSLPCILAQAQAVIDAAYGTFDQESFAITEGIDSYSQTLQTSKGAVTLTICRNLTYSSGTILQVDKDLPKRLFSCFAAYESFLRATLKNIAKNMQSPARRHQLSFVSGISTGYDSPAICALARDAGLKDVFTFTKARGNVDDDGSTIAGHLGLRVHPIDRFRWKKLRGPEIPFIAAVGFASGVELSAVESLLHQRVYMSGSFGDEMWGLDTEPEKIRRYRRKEHTGLDLTEFRLWKHFIHMPVPYIGYMGMEDILRISKSAEMKFWDVSTTPYEHYSRPIPRRILEGAGVPRHAFAFEKRAATYGDFETNLTRGTLSDVYAFNRALSRSRRKRNMVGKRRSTVGWFGWRSAPLRTRLPTVKMLRAPSLLDRIFFAGVIALSQPLLWLGRKSFRGSWRIKHVGIYLQQYRSYEFSFNHCFPWALMRAIAVYKEDSHPDSGRK